MNAKIPSHGECREGEIFGRTAFSNLRAGCHRLKSQSLKRLPVLIRDRFNISSQGASGSSSSHRSLMSDLPEPVTNLERTLAPND